MTLCAPNETLDKGNLGQKGLSDNTKVDFGATKIMVSNGSLMRDLKHYKLSGAWYILRRNDTVLYSENILFCRHLYSLIFLSCGENNIQHIPTEIGEKQ